MKTDKEILDWIEENVETIGTLGTLQAPNTKIIYWGKGPKPKITEGIGLRDACTKAMINHAEEKAG